MTHEAIALTFDRWALEGKDAGMEDGHGDVVRQVIDKMDIRPGQQILDLGCGNGWATRILGQAAPGTGAVGVDASKEMIARAESLHSYTIRARYEVGTFETLNLPDGRFDRIFSMEALYYAVDLAKTLTEMLRVLKSGGTADVVLDFYWEAESTHVWSEAMGLAMNLLSEAEWKTAFEEAGFDDANLCRVVDSRGPGDEAEFVPSPCFPDWSARVAAHEAGSLWIHAVKPA
jgi:ubiquinone/menaquinone biosynthesis C-methylase UbiE